MELRQGQVSLAKLTLPEGDPLVGQRMRDLPLPENTALAIVIRDSGIVLPQPDDVLEAGDEMLFFAGGAIENQVWALVRGATKPLRDAMSCGRRAGQYRHDRLDSACQRTADVLANVTDDQLNASTPCEKLRLDELVAHVGVLALAFTAAARKDFGAADRHPANRRCAAR